MLFKSQVAPLQTAADGNSQNGGKNDGDNSVENGGGDLTHDRNHSSVRSQSLDQQTAVKIGLGQIQRSIGQRAGQRCQNGLDIVHFLVTGHDHQTGNQAISALGQESDPGFGDVQGIHHIIDGRAKTCCQTAQPGAQQNAGQGTHDIAQVERSGTGNINGNGDPQGRACHSQVLDGGLIGGACLKIEDFEKLINTRIE